MKKGKKQVKFAPVFRPTRVAVVGIDKDGYRHIMYIVQPGIQYDSTGSCVVYIHKE